MFLLKRLLLFLLHLSTEARKNILEFCMKLHLLRWARETKTESEIFFFHFIYLSIEAMFFSRRRSPITPIGENLGSSPPFPGRTPIQRIDSEDENEQNSRSDHDE